MKLNQSQRNYSKTTVHDQSEACLTNFSVLFWGLLSILLLIGMVNADALQAPWNNLWYNRVRGLSHTLFLTTSLLLLLKWLHFMTTASQLLCTCFPARVHQREARDSFVHREGKHLWYKRNCLTPFRSVVPSFSSLLKNIPIFSFRCQRSINWHYLKIIDEHEIPWASIVVLQGTLNVL